MVPWLWLLTRTENSRIFQNLSVPDIVKKTFEDKGFQDVKLQLHGDYKPREYCVQYRETDYNFVCRLLEDEGIFYFFEHEKEKHTLLLADAPENHQSCPNQESAVYQTTTGGWFDEDTITGIEKRQEITAGKYTQTDYNFKTPATDLKVEVASQQALGPTELEIYHYPGVYEKRADGEDRTNLRMQEVETGIETIHGSSVCRAFTAGYRFDIIDRIPFCIAFTARLCRRMPAVWSIKRSLFSGRFSIVGYFCGARASAV
jgi:type VI secretion system secreted protein VgrG